jgi:hypothetical protein
MCAEICPLTKLMFDVFEISNIDNFHEEVEVETKEEKIKKAEKERNLKKMTEQMIEVARYNTRRKGVRADTQYSLRNRYKDYYLEDDIHLYRIEEESQSKEENVLQKENKDDKITSVKKEIDIDEFFSFNNNTKKSVKKEDLSKNKKIIIDDEIDDNAEEEVEKESGIFDKKDECLTEEQEERTGLISISSDNNKIVIDKIILNLDDEVKEDKIDVLQIIDDLIIIHRSILTYKQKKKPKKPKKSNKKKKTSSSLLQKKRASNPNSKKKTKREILQEHFMFYGKETVYKREKVDSKKLEQYLFN